MFGHPPYFWMPLYVWMPPACLEAHICLDAPMFGPPCMFGCPSCLDAPHMFGYPLCVWMPPVSLDIPICLDAPHMFRCPHQFSFVALNHGCAYLANFKISENPVSFKWYIVQQSRNMLLIGLVSRGRVQWRDLSNPGTTQFLGHFLSRRSRTHCSCKQYNIVIVDNKF